MGICFTKEQDDALARGWPHLIVPVDGRKEDKTPTAAENAWVKGDPTFWTEWPRKTLHRFVRFATTPREKGDVAAGKAALANDSAPSTTECLDGLRWRVREAIAKQPFAYRNVVWAVEAIAGTDATLECITSEMETSYPTIPERMPACEAVVSAASFLLLRASPSVAKSSRTRMEAIFAAPHDAAQAYEDYFGTLDFALHGAAGVKSFFAKYPKWTVWLEVPALYCAGSLDYADDPAFVRDVITKTDPRTLSPGMSVRVAAAGGSAALARLAKCKWPAAQMPSVVRDLGMIRAPEIVTFIASLVGKSAAKDAPMQWLRAHADYARPILAKEKSNAATLALRQLDQ